MVQRYPIQHSTYIGGGICAITSVTDEMYHFGIQGMKWGHRNGPPYPLKPGARSSAEKKAKTPIAEKYADFKAKRKRKAAVKKAQTTRKKKAQYEADRQKMLRQGTADDILKTKNVFRFTNKELEGAIERIKWENKLTELSAESIRVRNGRKVAESMLSNKGFVGRLKEYTGNIAGVIDNVNKINKGLKGEVNKDDKSNKKDGGK